MSFEYLTKDFIFDHTAFEQIKQEAPTYYIFGLMEKNGV